MSVRVPIDAECQAWKRLNELQVPHAVLPDESVGNGGRPSPLAARGMIDFHPFETEAFIKQVLAMDWERLIPGHPGPGDRLGTKKDVEDPLTLLQEASAEMKKMGRDGKCRDTAEKEFRMPKYAGWPGYESGLPFVARRYCGLWGRGT